MSWQDPEWTATTSLPEQTGCPVCDSALAPDPFRRGVETCGSTHCAQVMQQKHRMPALLFDQHLRFQRQILQERKVAEARENARRQAIDNEESVENRLALQSVKKQHPELIPLHAEPETHVIALPSSSSRIVPVAQERREHYARHVAEVIIRAMLTHDSDDVFLQQNEEKRELTDSRLEQSPALNDKSDQFCGLCKGGCCTAGGDDALLDARGLRRYMLAHPELTPLQIYQQYVDRLPEQAVEGSCINHTSHGCALTREMRSDVCNGYFCDSVKQHQRQMLEETDPGRPVLTLVRGYSNFRRYGEDVDRNILISTIVQA